MTPTAQMTALWDYMTNTCQHQIGIVYLAVDGTTGGVLNRWSHTHWNGKFGALVGVYESYVQLDIHGPRHMYMWV